MAQHPVPIAARRSILRDCSHRTLVTVSGVFEVDFEQTEFAASGGLTISDSNNGLAVNQRGESGFQCHLERVRLKHPNAYRKWSFEDDQELGRLFDAGMTTRELASVFQRTDGAIRLRLMKLGYLGERPWEGTPENRPHG